MLRRILLLATVLTMGVTDGRSQVAGWTARWIGENEPSKPNEWLCYRAGIDLERTPVSARVRVACDSKYWLWINGQMVVFEGQLKRGPTPTGTYYDELELAPYLRAGRNSVAVLVWYWGKSGFSHNNSGRIGLIFDADIDGRRWGSCREWRIVRHPGFQDTEGTRPNFRLAEPNIRFDARKDLDGWYQARFDDSAWPQAQELGQASVTPWGELFARPIPQWTDSGLIEYSQVEELKQSDGSSIFIGRLPYNAQVTPAFVIDAPPGLLVKIQSDNYLGGGAPNVRAEYVTSAGRQNFESYGWMNGHDIRYHFPGGVKVLSLKYRETAYSAEVQGHFSCDDEALNALWRKARRTLQVTMRDNFMDCPDRERAQWWGDVVNELGESFYVFDYVHGPSLTRKAILELARWHKPDGTLYAPVPSGRPDFQLSRAQLSVRPEDGVWGSELPAQMLASVGSYGFWQYYLSTADISTLREVYPVVRQYLSLWRLGADGLVEHRAGDWDWIDWGKNIDARVCENAWFVIALRGAIEMALATDNVSDVALYRKTLESIEGSFGPAFWRGNEYRSAAYTGLTDDRAQALAVVAGLAKPSQFPAIRRVLATSYEASPYMEKYVLEALYQMRAPDQAIARMKRRWSDQIASPLTTLWEGWGLGEAGYGGGTYNHAWSGGALTVLSQYAAGVAVTSPGWATYRIAPQLGGLGHIMSVVPTPHGSISLDVRRSPDGSIEILLDSPAGTTGEFHFPGDPRLRLGNVDGQECDSSLPVKILPGRHVLHQR